ncbi:ribonuclease H-like domain-containing protein [Tanacetum coccineum]
MEILPNFNHDRNSNPRFLCHTTLIFRGLSSYQKLPKKHIKLSVLKLDGSSFCVEVSMNATVADVKSALEDYFTLSPKDDRYIVSWSHVWGHFCLCYEGQKLLDDKICIRRLGIKDGDQIRFVRHVTINYRPAKQQIKDLNDELRLRSVSSAHEDGEFVDASNCDSVKDQQSNIFQCECEEDSSFQENTGYWQQHNPHESPVEEVATSPTKNKKKATRNRQKKMSQSADAPRQTLWTTEEEIALCKGWLAVSENSRDGNAKKQSGFWVEVLEYVESKTKQHGRRTYDMVIGKWKTVRASVIRFCGIYNNVMRMAQESGAGDKITAAARKKKGSKSGSTSNVNEDALTKLMVTKMTAQEKEERLTFLDIKMREVECRERELEQQDMRFYL